MEKEKKEIWDKSRFSKRIRIDPKQLQWIQENKNTRSAAGFLDIIINSYKKHYDYKETNGE